MAAAVFSDRSSLAPYPLAGEGWGEGVVTSVCRWHNKSQGRIRWHIKRGGGERDRAWRDERLSGSLAGGGDRCRSGADAEEPRLPQAAPSPTLIVAKKGEGWGEGEVAGGK